MKYEIAYTIFKHCGTFKLDEGRQVVILHLYGICADLRRCILDALSNCEYVVFCYAYDLDSQLVLSIPIQSFLYLSARAAGLKCDLSKTRREGYYVHVTGLEENIDYPSLEIWFKDYESKKKKE